MRFDRLVVRGVFLALLVISFSISVFAQSDFATLGGRVTDQGGLVIAGAKVQVINVGTGVTATADTNDVGLYNFPSLLPGAYRIVVEKEGFLQILKPDVTLHVTDVVAVNFQMQVGSITQSVTVEGEAPLVNTTTTTLGGLVNEQKMTDLPLNGRNFVDLTLLQAGVSNDSNYGGSNAQGGTGGVYFSSNGSPIRSNNFTVDGAPMMNIRGNTTSAVGTTLGVDGILEYKMITNSFSAEYGLTMGSQVVIATKSGTNRFSGDVFEYLRNNAMDARNFFDYSYATTGKRLPQFQRNNFGGSIGGPIRKDKTFFFVVYEGLRQNFGATIIDAVPAAGCHGTAGQVIWNGSGTPPPGNAGTCTQLGSNPSGAGTNSVTISPVTVGLLGLFPTPDLPNNQFTYPVVNPTRVDFGQVRMDQQFSTSDSMFGRYTIDDAYNTSGASYPQYDSLTQGREQYLTLSETHIFSTSVLNSARVTYTRSNSASDNVYLQNVTGPLYSFVAGQPIGQLTVSGFTQNGSPGLGNSLSAQNVYSLNDDVSYTKGRHAFKFGILANRFEYYVNQGTKLEGLLAFSNLANLMLGNASSYSRLAPGSNGNNAFLYYTYGFYAQDDWRFNSRLTFNLGLRYEFNTTVNDKDNLSYAYRNIATAVIAAPNFGTVQGPPFDDPSYKNFSPRVGLAWDVAGNGKTAIRAAFGEYYDLGNLQFVLSQPGQGTPPRSELQAVSTTTAITLPLTFSGTAVLPSLQTTQFYIQQPHMLQWNLTVDRQLPSSSAISVSYVGNRGIHLWESQEGNPCTPTTITNGIPFWATDCGQGRLNPGLSTALLHTTNGDSSYEALQVVFTKRASHGLEVQGAYTYSKNLDDSQGQGGGMECVSTGANLPEYSGNQQFNKGPSCFDATHNVRFNVLYHIPDSKWDNVMSRSLLRGWWTGMLTSWETGYPFTPMVGISRSRSDNLTSTTNVSDRAAVGTATVAPGQTGVDGTVNTTADTFIPYNASTVITGNPQQWFNPLMFTAGPVGYLGTASRDMLRGPHLSDFDWSFNKDTALPFLGEGGKLVFRAELFNIFNHANFGMPTGTAYAGTLTQPGSYVETPLTTAGQITKTVTTSRQIQLALKVIF